MIYEDDSIQSFCGTWWRKDNSSDISRGRLIWAFLSHVDQIPFSLILKGRSEPRNHSEALYEMKPLKIKQKQPKNTLPVAALPLFDKETLIVNKAKKRPALIVSNGGEEIPKNLRIGKPKWQTSPTIIVAPYYGADEANQKKLRAGLNPELKKRIRRGMYPQYILDILPITNSTKESFLRLDHIQPLGKHHDSIELTEYRLSDEALNILDEWFNWLIYGNLDPDSNLYYLKDSIKNLP